jgi:hypothetical protein
VRGDGAEELGGHGAAGNQSVDLFTGGHLGPLVMAVRRPPEGRPALVERRLPV